MLHGTLELSCNMARCYVFAKTVLKLYVPKFLLLSTFMVPGCALHVRTDNILGPNNR